MSGGFKRVGRLLESDRVVGRISPVWLLTRVLGVNLWSKQADILNAVRDHDYVAVRSCNGSGKTFTAALATLWWLICHDDAMVVTTAPTGRQVKELLWREIRWLHQKNLFLIGGKMSSDRLELSEKRFGFGLTTSSMNRIQGIQSENILVVVDEASGVKDEVFAGISSCLTTENSKMLMLSNPMGTSGTFYDAFHKNRKNWKRIHISAFDTPAFEGLDMESLHSESFEVLKAKSELSEVNGCPRDLTSPAWAKFMLSFTWGASSTDYRRRVLGEFVDDREIMSWDDLE